MWEQIRANRLRSIALITVMAVLLILVGYSSGVLIGGEIGGIYGVLVALVIWAGMMLVYFFGAESILLNEANAIELKHEDSPRLFNVVEEMQLASGLERAPRLYLIDAFAPNAFTIGRKPETSAIGVTSGLMYRLNRDELQGVIAHEISHLKNHDVQFMTLAAIMLGTIVMLSEMVSRGFASGGRGRSRTLARGGGVAGLAVLGIALVVVVLGPLMAQILYFTCSRKREFLADACAAQYTRYPDGLASALEKISRAPHSLGFASKAIAPLFITNPMYAEEDAPDSIFASHPPTSERIRILHSMAGASLGDYEEAYRQARGSGLIGAGSLQNATPQSIREPLDEGPIETRENLRQLIYRSQGYLQIRCNCGLTMSIPESYQDDKIHCIRCGSVLPLPAAKERSALAGDRPKMTDAAEPPLQYTRTGIGWESFRCSCGRTVQVSPAFEGSHLRCSNCGRNIEVSPHAA